ncbi:retrovirus-related pol polyprotein from transposon TNT 1-94, partial [Trifolium medium]|nr:retrovirus-related pol polyprotein from transposon TNT 1-94 [Trifolium medium]
KSTKGNDSFTFTKSQYENLVNLLQSNAINLNASSSTQVNGASTSNLANTNVHSKSGASDHICSTLALFDHHHDIVPIQVKMPNGTIAYAKKAGSITLGLGFTIDDVLLDKRNLKMIGSGELIEGLYYLTNKPQPVAANTHSVPTHNSPIHLPTQALWHFRLGHLSHARLLLMQSHFPFVTLDSKSVCD